MGSTKRQTTMAKMAREQAVREKRARKEEKKENKKLGIVNPATVTDDELAEDAVEEAAPVE